MTCYNWQLLIFTGILHTTWNFTNRNTKTSQLGFRSQVGTQVRLTITQKSMYSGGGWQGDVLAIPPRPPRIKCKAEDDRFVSGAVMITVRRAAVYLLPSSQLSPARLLGQGERLHNWPQGILCCVTQQCWGSSCVDGGWWLAFGLLWHLTLSSMITRSRGSVRSILRTRCLVWAWLLPTRKYLWNKPVKCEQ